MSRFEAAKAFCEVGAVPPAGRSVMSRDAYGLRMNGEKSGHMRKTCNGVHDLLGLRGLGWA